MQDIIITIIGIIFTALGGVIARYVIPWLRQRTSSAQWELITATVEAVVRAAYAEGVKNGWNGDTQKAWAIAHAKDIFDIDLTEAQYDLIRKAVVQQVKAIEPAPDNSGVRI